jgi:hypothetical protein
MIAARLDFDRRPTAPATDEDVDLAAAQREVARDDAISQLLQKSTREVFPGLAGTMPWLLMPRLLMSRLLMSRLLMSRVLM